MVFLSFFLSLRFLQQDRSCVFQDTKRFIFSVRNVMSCNIFAQHSHDKKFFETHENYFPFHVSRREIISHVSVETRTVAPEKSIFC